MTEGQLRPIDLARAMGISVASVRFYEAEGILPPVPRTASGHRRFQTRHLEALRTARALMAGYGWVHAREVMRAVHAGERAGVTALADARHAALHRERNNAIAIVDALRRATTASAAGALPGVAGTPLRVGEVARQVEIPVSTLHFWEQSGLVRPARDPGNGYRLYSPTHVQHVRVVGALRTAGYGIPRIRDVMDGLAAGDPAAALHHLEQRQHELIAASEACMAATAALWAYIRQFGDRSP